MRTVAYRAVATLGAVVITAGLRAEPPIGSRLGERQVPGFELNAKVAAAAAHDFAICAVDHRGSRIRRYLNATTVAEARSLGDGMLQELQCINMPDDYGNGMERHLHVSDDVERGLLAEAFLEEAHYPVPAPLTAQKVYASPWSVVSGRSPSIDEMAICVADIDPAGVEGLLQTHAATPQSSSALSALAPTLGSCLAKGATLHANMQSMRAALAEGLYHRWQADTTQQAVATK